jgi:hypothetical protein
MHYKRQEFRCAKLWATMTDVRGQCKDLRGVHLHDPYPNLSPLFSFSLLNFYVINLAKH